MSSTAKTFRVVGAVLAVILIVWGVTLALSGQVVTPGDRLASPQNSTAVALAADATFVGTPVRSPGFSWVSIEVSTDVTGSIYVDTSPDGINWISRPMTLCLPLPCFRSLSINITASLTRIRYLNGPAPQGHLRIQTVFHSGARPVAAPVAHPIHGEFFQDAMTTGEVELTADIPRDVWGFASAIDFAATPGTVDLVSDNAEDNPAGDGAGVVLIAGVGSDGVFAFEAVALNGETPVTTATQFKPPLAFMQILTVGSGAGSNEFGTGANGQTGEISSAAGIITATLTAGGENMAVIRQDLGKNQALSANLIIPLAFGGHQTTVVVRELIVSTRDITAQGSGQYTVEFLAKRPGAPAFVLTVPFEGSTNEPGTHSILVNEPLASGMLQITRAVSDKALTLGVTYIVRIYIASFECTGDCF